MALRKTAQCLRQHDKTRLPEKAKTDTVKLHVCSPTQEKALDNVADAKFCATKIAVRNVACCKTVAKQQNTTRLKTKKTASACRFFHIFEKFLYSWLIKLVLVRQTPKEIADATVRADVQFSVTVCQNSQQF